MAKRKTTKKAGVKIPASFKNIVRRKNKAGRYYYYYTEKIKGKSKKKIVTKAKFEREQILKDSFKKHYGKDWRKKYNQAVRIVTKDEKKEIKREAKFNYELFVKELQARGYPYNWGAYFNYTIISEVEENYNNDFSFLKFDNNHYRLNDNNIENFRFLITAIVEYYWEKLRELYSPSELDSPHVIFEQSEISGPGRGAAEATDIPRSRVVDLDRTSFKQPINKTPKQVIGLYFKNYFGTIPKVKDIYLFLYEKTKAKQQKENKKVTGKKQTEKTAHKKPVKKKGKNE